LNFENGGRIWRLRKVDILFVVGIGLMVYGAARGRIDIVMVGGAAVGIPLTQRGDKP
jgi:hypothetical protein